jgi:hypothetical protein
MKRVTIVVEGGDVGAALAKGFAKAEGIASTTYVHRRDGSVQVSGQTDDGGARGRWVKRCRRAGLTVARAPWEKTS